MFEIDLENKIKSKSVTGVEIILLPSGGYEINAVVLKKKKNSLFTEKKISGLRTIDELSKSIDIKSAMVIVLNGRGIIHKKVLISENDTTSTLLNKALPNAGKDDFCMELNEIDEQHSFVSVIRSETLNLILDELKALKITNIASGLIGPFVINELLQTIKLQNNLIEIPGFKMEVKENRINAISSEIQNGNNEDVLVEGEAITKNLLIPFAGAMSYYTRLNGGIENSERLTHLKEEYKEKRKFELMGWGVLVLVFMIVGLNSLIFSNYWTKNNQMTSELMLNSSAVQHCDTLKKELSLKREFLEQNGLLENARTSFYADRLAASIPSSIEWTDVAIHPLKKKESGDNQEGFLFENKKILISGKCQLSTELNDWMKEVKHKEWIADVSLLSYVHDKGANEGVFTVEVKLK